MSPLSIPSLRNSDTNAAGRGRLPVLGAGPSGAEQAPQAGSSSTSIKDRVSLSLEAQQIQKLAAADREVRAHEAAHAAVGGQYAGSASFSYQTGPDGKRYAVGGEVPIDLSAVSSDPAATIKKAQTVRAAALAPAQPSPQDLQVAAAASRMEQSARSALRQQQSAVSGKPRTQTAGMPAGTPPVASSRTEGTPLTHPSASRLNLYA